MRAGVWLVDPATRKVKLRKVTIGQSREDGVTVTGGLQPGDVVVTAGVPRGPWRSSFGNESSPFAPISTSRGRARHISVVTPKRILGTGDHVPNARTVVLDGVGHFLPEEDPQRVLELLRD